MNTVGAFPGGGSDDLRRKISELNPTIAAPDWLSTFYLGG